MDRRMPQFPAILFRRPFAAAGLLMLIAGTAIASGDALAQPSAAAVTCTNPMNGASWQIAIDYGKGTVDSHPAQITPGKISWFDANDGGNYTLDRTSGDFTAIIASSTGGYFRRGHCNLEKAR
jgi:hypothetical protein